VQVIWVWLTLVGVMDAPFRLTLVEARTLPKLLPVIVRLVPPAVGKLVAVIEVMDGLL